MPYELEKYEYQQESHQQSVRLSDSTRSLWAIKGKCLFVVKLLHVGFLADEQGIEALWIEKQFNSSLAGRPRARRVVGFLHPSGLKTPSLHICQI
eukprot:scaffold279991_cov14-Prasinocladus_malaysianus.AAC.1